MESLSTYLVAGALVAFFVWLYQRGLKKKEAQWRAAAVKGNLISAGPKAQHPHIDTTHCIGCQSCTSVCPEGEVLGMVGARAAIINGYKCIGHSLCADACPVGAITMVMANPSMSAELPALTADHETNVANLFIAGELGGLALIKNAVNQGRECIDTIAVRLARSAPQPGVCDVVIVGAGPAGISASLRAIERKLSYVTLEQDEVGGTVAKYPRQKLVMTTPVEFPMYGKFSKMELSKEDLLGFWRKVMQRADFRVRSGEKVEDIRKEAGGLFTLTTSKGQYRSRAVVLALGRTGTPRKLGVPGEDLPNVMYRLIEADHYVNKKVLIVGGGDSAVEAAMGLAHQVGNEVTISCRQEQFTRIKARNQQRIEECIRAGKVRALFGSQPIEFRRDGAVLDMGGEHKHLLADYCWIFAGGTPPNDFLQKVGVKLGTLDLTAAGQESRESRAASLTR